MTIEVTNTVELQRTIEGGCNCPECKATLAIDARAQRHTWTVHYPELARWR